MVVCIVQIGEAPSEHATYIGTPGKRILVADESTDTIGKHLVSINVDNIEENRRILCELLFLTPGALECISGGILYHETKDGKLFVDVLNENGVLPGIEVDMGTIAIAGTDGETTTQAALTKRCMKDEFWAFSDEEFDELIDDEEDSNKELELYFQDDDGEGTWHLL